MTDYDRVVAYVRAYSARHQEFPCVRRVARSLKLRQSDVEDAADQAPLMLTSYFTVPADPLGDHFVEICE